MFHTASGGGIRSGTTADISFERAQKILKTLENTSHVTMDVPTTHLPRGCSLAILSTAKEVTALCEGTPVDVEAYVEWTISCPQEPVMTLNGGFARTLCAARTARRLAGGAVFSFRRATYAETARGSSLGTTSAGIRTRHALRKRRMRRV